jgi:rare lipoprotein A (peptidoglycan hydrolase)
MQTRTRAGLSDKNLKVGDKVKVRGRVVPGGTRRKLTVKVGGDKIHTKTRRNGTFSAKWKASKVGSDTVRVRAEGNKVATGSGDKAGKVHVYRPAEASYYGPGLYGNGVACGGTLQPDTIGVAHKSLPCGTKLTIRYKGHHAKAKVIDRGPYVAGREFDLTEALRNKLHFPGVGTIWVDR